MTWFCLLLQNKNTVTKYIMYLCGQLKETKDLVRYEINKETAESTSLILKIFARQNDHVSNKRLLHMFY